jgi:hypothetical protein
LIPLPAIRTLGRVGLIDRRAQIACSMLRCRRTEAAVAVPINHAQSGAKDPVIELGLFLAAERYTCLRSPRS